MVYAFATGAWTQLQPHQSNNLISEQIPDPYDAALDDTHGYVALSDHRNLGVWDKGGVCVTWLKENISLLRENSYRVGTFLPNTTHKHEAQLLYTDRLMPNSWYIRSLPNNRLLRHIEGPSYFSSSVQGKKYLADYFVYKNGCTKYSLFCLPTQNYFELIFPPAHDDHGWAGLRATLSPHAHALALFDIDASPRNYLDVIHLKPPSLKTQADQAEAFMRGVSHHEIPYLTLVVPQAAAQWIAKTFLPFIPHARLKEVS